MVVRSRKVTYQGRTQTISEWARELGVSYGLLYTRLSSGWSVEEAMTLPLQTVRRSPDPQITHAGRTQALSEWAREYGIRRLLLEVRLAKGWPMGRALKS